MAKIQKDRPTVLIIATLDTKLDETRYLRSQISGYGIDAIIMDCGVLEESPLLDDCLVDICSNEVAEAGGDNRKTLVRSGDKAKCIATMIKGVQELTTDLFSQGKFQSIIGIGGAQGTEIGTAAMRVIPFGVPKLMVSTIANGLTTFGPYVGTKDIMIMHSVSDLQGLNYLTKRILDNAAAAIAGMTIAFIKEDLPTVVGIPVAMSMLGTTTPGALYAKELLEKAGFQVVAFHQNGTGGIAMEDMIRNGFFKGVLDINLHEIGDLVGGGLHRAIREYRLESAGMMGLPQVVAPGSINYAVWGTLSTLTPAQRERKHIVHNQNLTLVRLTAQELINAGQMTAQKLNRAKGPVHIFIPLRGFSFPDREGLPHWEPEGNQIFIDSLKNNLDRRISLEELDAHINDQAFIRPVVERFLNLMKESGV